MPGFRVAQAIASTTRNPGIAIGIAAANFPALQFGGTIILYAVLAGLVARPYAKWQQRRLITARKL